MQYGTWFRHLNRLDINTYAPVRPAQDVEQRPANFSQTNYDHDLIGHRPPSHLFHFTKRIAPNDNSAEPFLSS
jgi:hypothetical protein